MDKINFKAGTFEGPLDLLCHLIEKNEVNIYDIPVALIADQYIAYLSEADGRDMDSMSEFIVMASMLLELKSKMLLPKLKKEQQEEENDPREELVRRLLEYKRYKEVTEEFRKYAQEAQRIYYKKGTIPSFLPAETEVELSQVLAGITLEGLYTAFAQVMGRQEKKVDKVRSGFKAVERDLFTIEDKIGYIKDLLVITPKVTFLSIFRANSSKMEIVVTFLALLELVKVKYIIAVQKDVFDDIIVTKYIGSE